MEMARTMLNESKLNDKFQGHAFHTATHILNRGFLRNKNVKLPMSYGPVQQQVYDTSEYFEASATSKEKIRRLENLTLEQTREYSLDIHPRGNITNATI